MAPAGFIRPTLGTLPAKIAWLAAKAMSFQWSRHHPIEMTATRARTTGAVALRNEARSALVPLLQHLAAYVQETADANLETGASIIESAGIAVRKAP